MSKEPIETRRDEEGRLLVRGKCSVCKQCWVYLGGAMKGKCAYGGPFDGFIKDKDLEVPKEQGLPSVPEGGERPPWE